METAFDRLEHENFMIRVSGALGAAEHVLREEIAGLDGIAILQMVADELAGRATFVPGQRVQAGLLGQELHGVVVGTSKDGIFFKVDDCGDIIGLPSVRIELEGCDLQHRTWGTHALDVQAKDEWRRARREKANRMAIESKLLTT